MESKERKLYTLVFVFDWREEQILLGLKKRGFGSGKFNGFGGKVEPNEDVVAAAKRELEEECGLKVPSDTGEKLRRIGINLFEFSDHPIVMEVHIFMVDRLDTKGIVSESDEMDPKWFKFSEIPFHKMWTDDKHWFPFMFDRKPFHGYFLFQSIETDIVIEQSIQESKDLSIQESEDLSIQESEDLRIEESQS